MSSAVLLLMRRRLVLVSNVKQCHFRQSLSSSSSSSTAVWHRAASTTSKPPTDTTTKKKKPTIAKKVNINDIAAAVNSNFDTIDDDDNVDVEPAELSESDLASIRNRRNAIDAETALDASTVVKFLSERRLDDVLLVDVSRKCTWTNAMVFATGKSERQLVATANALVKEYREIIPTCAEDRPIIESDDKWVAVDCGLVVVHLFTAEGRALYQLDKTWINRPDLDQTGFLDPDPRGNLSANDDIEDDPEVEEAIAAAVEEARLDPTEFGLPGVVQQARSHVVRPNAVVIDQVDDDNDDDNDNDNESTTESIQPERKLVRGLLRRRMRRDE